MPNPDKTPGQKLVEEWYSDVKSWSQFLPTHRTDLVIRIDRLIAELTPKRVLDLSELFSWKDDGPRAVYLDEVESMIRDQLPDMEVRT